MAGAIEVRVGWGSGRTTGCVAEGCPAAVGMNVDSTGDRPEGAPQANCIIPKTARVATRKMLRGGKELCFTRQTVGWIEAIKVREAAFPLAGSAGYASRGGWV